MKARPVPASEKLIQDYLARVAEAALRLPKGNRMAFVGRTRARIERECGQAGLADPGRVMEVLAALGEPEELVRQERARIDAAWIRRRSADRAAGETGGAASAADAPTTPPGKYRRITARRKPATFTQPLPGPRQPQPGERQRPARRRPGVGWAGRRAPAQPPAGGTPSGPPSAPSAPGRPVPGGPPAAPSAAGPPSASGPPAAGAAPEPSAPGGPASGPSAPPEPGPGPVSLAGLVFEPESEAKPGTPVAATPLSADWAGVLARRTGQLARGHPLESTAIVLLGLGGLIFPILPPVWVAGSALALASRLWDPRDKWVALIGPLVFATLASAVTTALLGGQGNLVENYGHAFRVDIGYVLRLGCVASAAYLAWRVHRGPRVKLPPWKR